MLGKLKTFTAFPNAQKLPFIKIAVIVPVVEIGVKTVGFRRTFQILNRLAGKNRPAAENERSVVRRYANFLRLYDKNFSFTGKCLAQSLTLWFLLKRKGIETELKFGTKKRNRKIAAHAWLEYRNEPLTADRENFIPFSESVSSKLLK